MRLHAIWRLIRKKIEQAWQVNPWSEFDQTMWLNEYIALLANQLDYSMKN